MSKRCPQCNAIVEFAQADYRICDNCGWQGSWTELIDDREIPLKQFTINKVLAEAIIDMENISFSESLGSKTYEGCEEWRKFVLSVAKKFNLQNLFDDPQLRESC